MKKLSMKSLMIFIAFVAIFLLISPWLYLGGREAYSNWHANQKTASLQMLADTLPVELGSAEAVYLCEVDWRNGLVDEREFEAWAHGCHHIVGYETGLARSELLSLVSYLEADGWSKLNGHAGVSSFEEHSLSYEAEKVVDGEQMCITVEWTHPSITVMSGSKDVTSMGDDFEVCSLNVRSSKEIHGGSVEEILGL